MPKSVYQNGRIMQVPDNAASVLNGDPDVRRLRRKWQESDGSYRSQAPSTIRTIFGNDQIREDMHNEELTKLAERKKTEHELDTIMHQKKQYAHQLDLYEDQRRDIAQRVEAREHQKWQWNQERAAEDKKRTAEAIMGGLNDLKLADHKGDMTGLMMAAKQVIAAGAENSQYKDAILAQTGNILKGFRETKAETQRAVLGDLRNERTSLGAAIAADNTALSQTELNKLSKMMAEMDARITQETETLNALTGETPDESKPTYFSKKGTEGGRTKETVFSVDKNGVEIEGVVDTGEAPAKKAVSDVNARGGPYKKIQFDETERVETDKFGRTRKVVDRRLPDDVLRDGADAKIHSTKVVSDWGHPIQTFNEEYVAKIERLYGFEKGYLSKVLANPFLQGEREEVWKVAQEVAELNADRFPTKVYEDLKDSTGDNIDQFYNFIQKLGTGARESKAAVMFYSTGFADLAIRLQDTLHKVVDFANEDADHLNYNPLQRILAQQKVLSTYDSTAGSGNPLPDTMAKAMAEAAALDDMDIEDYNPYLLNADNALGAGIGAILNYSFSAGKAAWAVAQSEITRHNKDPADKERVMDNVRRTNASWQMQLHKVMNPHAPTMELGQAEHATEEDDFEFTGLPFPGRRKHVIRGNVVSNITDLDTKQSADMQHLIFFPEEKSMLRFGVVISQAEFGVLREHGFSYENMPQHVKDEFEARYTDFSK